MCGHEGFDVTPALYRSKAGKFHVIPRCTDHRACEERRTAL